MKHNKSPVQATTVSVDVSVRDYINQEAERLGLSQRQMVTRMAEDYERQINTSKEDGLDPQDLLTEIRDNLGKVLKRDDRVVAFIREQEKVLLNPILKSTQSTANRIEQLITILSNLS